ncbi:MAG: DUF1634 domain-containing protein [Bacillota bacterium]
MNGPSEQNQSLHELELTISKLLRLGVMAAGIFLAVGWIWLLFNNGDLLASFVNYEPHSFFETIQWSLINQDKAMLISLVGLALLVLLPIARVFMTGVLFIKQKDFILAGMAFAVFVCLIGSFILGVDL